jgi:hypothetical protein
MTYGIDSLHKILKDEKRRKIILLLSETENLSYMDLMNSLEIKSTGKLNYHLKILGDLLSKTEDGKYTLTEKGKTALQLLKNFPEENRQQLGLKPKWWRRFWIENLVFTVIVITAVTVTFFSGYIDMNGAQRALAGIISAIAISYMVTHIMREMISKRTQLVIAKTFFILCGALLALAITFLGVGLSLSALSRLLDKPLLRLFWNIPYMIFALFVAPSFGAVVGYLFGKRRRFRTPNYTPD